MTVWCDVGEAPIRSGGLRWSPYEQILIGRLGPTLGYNTKYKILDADFAKALKDPFVHTRIVGLVGLMGTADRFEVDELASKVIPSISFNWLTQSW